MTKAPRRWAIAAATVSALLVLAGCAGGNSGTTSGSGGGAAGSTVAFLMPDLASTRYEQQDSPLFKARMKQLCSDCKVIYQNAAGDPAKQQQQADSVITQGAKVIVISAVDTTAAAAIVRKAQSQKIKVVTYDRPIVKTAADFYVSFDNEGIGKLIAQSLVDKLQADGASGGVLQINGSPTDDAAQLIKKGVSSVVDPSEFKVLAEYDTPAWDPQKAQDWASGQVTQFGPQIAGVVAANDGTASGAIAAFKAGNVDPVPPVTGNDAEVAAIQRIVSGSQYNTISKPIKIVAGAAAEVTWALLQGKKPKQTDTLFNTPSQLFTPKVVTKDNVKEIIFDGGIYTAAKVCTGEYAAGCAALGVQ
ncbi:MAG: sugar ABC transporter substrate-binding protein [Micrococcales bacterium]|nr:sugar ABC transporter substrate-binding protein [Micrococcales bacterium]